MREDVFAQRALAVVMPPDRAAAVVGDLLEGPPRTRAWFWRSIAGVGISCIVRDMAAAPVRMTLSAVVTWFGYLMATLLLLFAAYLGAMVLWDAATILGPHTGLELLAGLVPPDLADGIESSRFMTGIEAGIVFALAPFLTGRRIGDLWKERAIAFVTAVAIVWSPLVVLVPFVAVSSRVGWSSLGVVLLFMLLGAIAQRRAELVRRTA